MKRLTLSFDNGPTEGTTAVLDALAERSIKTSFFLVGKQLQAPGARALAERAKAEGHWIGNHTLSHDVPLGMADAPHGHHMREIEQMDVLLGALSEDVPLFRPYAGKGILGPHVFTAESLDYLRRTRHTVVLHDKPNDAMKYLPQFLDAVMVRGVEIRQDFSPDCLPVVAGEAQWDASALVRTT
jgi:peptidoglycan/xylan/chitin deacetylase (PgdA/CDA1 family)